MENDKNGNNYNECKCSKECEDFCLYTYFVENEETIEENHLNMAEFWVYVHDLYDMREKVKKKLKKSSSYEHKDEEGAMAYIRRSLQNELNSFYRKNQRQREECQQIPDLKGTSHSKDWKLYRAGMRLIPSTESEFSADENKNANIHELFPVFEEICKHLKIESDFIREYGELVDDHHSYKYFMTNRNYYIFFMTQWLIDLRQDKPDIPLNLIEQAMAARNECWKFKKPKTTGERGEWVMKANRKVKEDTFWTVYEAARPSIYQLGVDSEFMSELQELSTQKNAHDRYNKIRDGYLNKLGKRINAQLNESERVRLEGHLVSVFPEFDFRYFRKGYDDDSYRDK